MFAPVVPSLSTPLNGFPCVGQTPSQTRVLVQTDPGSDRTKGVYEASVRVVSDRGPVSTPLSPGLSPSQTGRQGVP